MLANLANVLWLWVGWVLLEFTGYSVTFFFLGIVLLWLFWVSIFKAKEFKLY
jgi:hypothetical protein